MSTQLKRKGDVNNEVTNVKRVHTDYLQPTSTMIPTDLPARPTTPPLGMTLSHYNPSTGTYTSSQLISEDQVTSSICTGMTPAYKPSFERWGSCII
ncbi:hypothetical protein BDF21DRAFT_369001 [Thamnidium elegans]|nr:hypothetical protein BDF21DRAFT_369001 [Thamnidium elegans]